MEPRWNEALTKLPPDIRALHGTDQIGLCGMADARGYRDGVSWHCSLTDWSATLYVAADTPRFEVYLRGPHAHPGTVCVATDNVAEAVAVFRLGVLQARAEADKVKAGKRPCRYCGQAVTSTNPKCDYCRDCYYGGRGFGQKYERACAILRALPNVQPDTVGPWHTGGGCWALGATFTDGSYLLCTDGEAALPERVTGPWTFSLFTDEDADRGYNHDTPVTLKKLDAALRATLARREAGEPEDF